MRAGQHRWGMLSAAEQMRPFFEQEPLLRPDHARPRADGRVLWVGAATRSSFRRGSTRSRAAWSSRTREFRSERERAGCRRGACVPAAARELFEETGARLASLGPIAESGRVVHHRSIPCSRSHFSIRSTAWSGFLRTHQAHPSSLGLHAPGCGSGTCAAPSCPAGP